MPGEVYSTEDIAIAFGALAENQSNLIAAVKVNRHTLQDWRERHLEIYAKIEARYAREIEDRLISNAREQALRIDEVTSLAVEKTFEYLGADKLDDPSKAAMNLARTKDIGLDKMLLLQGRPNEITDDRDLQAALRWLIEKKVVNVVDGEAEEILTALSPGGNEPDS